MKLSEFKINFDETLIAKFPKAYRDDSRLMVINRAEQTIEHKQFNDIVDYFDEGDTFILNNSKVFPARLFGKKEKTGAKIEVFLLRELNKDLRLWDVLVDPARKIRVGNKLFFTNEQDEDLLVAEVIDNTTSRGRTIRFLTEVDEVRFAELLIELGEPPVPRHIIRDPENITEEEIQFFLQTPHINEIATFDKKDLKSDDSLRKRIQAMTPEERQKMYKNADLIYYQNIYAKNVGAVTAPAAGFHFSSEIFKRMTLKGIITTEITLHLGLGSFRIVETEDLIKHKLESENFIIEEPAAIAVNKAKRERKQICCVGNSVLRAIESSVNASGQLKAVDTWTEKFIVPPHVFHIPTSLLTNFHVPKSPYYISSSTFCGEELFAEAYNQAMKERYRLLDFGDAMLIL